MWVQGSPDKGPHWVQGQGQGDKGWGLGQGVLQERKGWVLRGKGRGQEGTSQGEEQVERLGKVEQEEGH